MQLDTAILVRLDAATAAWLVARAKDTLVPTSAFIRKLIANEKAKAEKAQ
jgi:hypothetical protein